MQELQKKLWGLIIKSYRDDFYSCTLELSNKYLDLYPKDYYGWVIRADVLNHLNQFDIARQSLEEALKVVPSNKSFFVYSQIGHHNFKKSD